MTRRMTTAAGLMLLAGGLTWAAGQDGPKVAQPPQPKVLPAQPALPKAVVNRLEEELELLEANRDVRRAHVRAAEVGVEAAKLGVERLRRIVASGASTKEELDKAVLEVKAAEAQLEIRLAEVKEVEVKIKYARLRLDDARGKGPADPETKPNPKGNSPLEPADPTVRKAEAEVEVAKFRVQVAKADQVLANAEYNLLAPGYANGIGPVTLFEYSAAKAKAKAADTRVLLAASLLTEAEAELNKHKQ